MNQWIQILLDAEESWDVYAASRSLSVRKRNAKEYTQARDLYKARYIFDNYGYNYFLRFCEGCSNARGLLEEITPCDKDGQCMVFCKFYEMGGCLNATKRMD